MISNLDEACWHHQKFLKNILSSNESNCLYGIHQCTL